MFSWKWPDFKIGEGIDRGQITFIIDAFPSIVSTWW
jgi:hypothetical protein